MIMSNPTPAPPSPPRILRLFFAQFGTYKLIYRRYAGLFFTFGMDANDNELLALETIHLFVELLESYFSNVCELDIVFNFNKARESIFVLFRFVSTLPHRSRSIFLFFSFRCTNTV